MSDMCASFVYIYACECTRKGLPVHGFCFNMYACALLCMCVCVCVRVCARARTPIRVHVH